ncbi:hypothetical protein LXA43DRAFT_181553 [Ganoderma leucocontextum]|nr:hypothetical protein LXA43DRAFT_181553 [Ganoderma leucocontextum]
MDSAGSFHSGETITDDSITPLNAAGLPVMPPPSHLETYPGHHQDISYSEVSPLQVPPLATHDVRGMYTPSPTSSTSSPYQESSPLSFYAPDAPLGSPYTFPPTSSFGGSPSGSGPSSGAQSRRQARRLSEPAVLDGSGLVVRGQIAHPYARLYSKKNGAGKRRKMWNHALEKMLFSPQEISNMGAPHRRTIYTASLEAHVDRLHDQLASHSLAPVPPRNSSLTEGLMRRPRRAWYRAYTMTGPRLSLKCSRSNAR